MRIALGQIDILLKNQIKNVEKCEKFIKNASENKAQLIIFPEMTLTGVLNDIEYLNKESKNIMSFFENMSVKYNINICFGYGKPNDDKCKNTLCVISKGKKKLAEYTKIHPFSFDGEDKYYVSGKNLSFFKIDDITFSNFICYDLRFPEIFQVASKKAEAIIVSANWPQNRREHWITLLKARAIENQCYIVGVNRIGKFNNLVYSGDSIVVDPFGKVIAMAGNKEGLLFCDITSCTVKMVREKYRFKKDRQEELYIKFLKNN